MSEKKYNREGIEKTKNKMFEAVKKLSAKDYNEVSAIIDEYGKGDEITDELHKEYEETLDLREKIVSSLDKGKINKEAYVGKAKLIFNKVIERTFDYLGCRDIAEIYHKGDVLIASGGMSWGDEPTDGYGVIVKFINLPKRVLKAGGIR
jgi:uncharacterized protein YydD (DUF2326 family)